MRRQAKLYAQSLFCINQFEMLVAVMDVLISTCRSKVDAKNFKERWIGEESLCQSGLLKEFPTRFKPMDERMFAEIEAELTKEAFC